MKVVYVDEMTVHHQRACFDLLMCVYNLLASARSGITIRPECMMLINHAAARASMEAALLTEAPEGAMQ